MNRVDGWLTSVICARLATGSAPNKRGVKAVPFREHATSFTPEQLDVLTTAFYAAVAELSTAGVEISQRDLAKRILDRAADGTFDVAELKRAALDGLV
jgi:hypothetical protein